MLYNVINVYSNKNENTYFISTFVLVIFKVPNDPIVKFKLEPASTEILMQFMISRTPNSTSGLVHPILEAITE